jgi:tetratricopeptide (TPR) repeat protein
MLRRNWKKLAFLVLLTSLAAWLVNQSLVAFPFSSDRIEVSRSYLERAMDNKDPSGEDLRVALSGLKWAVEASRPGDPWIPYGRFHLGRAYAFLGLYSYALSEFDRLQASETADGPAAVARLMVLEEYSRSGDVVGEDAIPPTPFEQAESHLARGDYQRARQLYRAILERDPFHYSAINRLGLVYYLSGKLEESLEVLTLGLRYYPDDPTMVENARQITVQLGHPSQADDLMRKYGE